MKKDSPNYSLIYKNLITKKYPDKIEECYVFFKKEKFSTLDVIKLNKILFTTQSKHIISFDQKHRSYDKSSIMEILNYQKKNNLSNSQLAAHFSISRNTIAKWKKIKL